MKQSEILKQPQILSDYGFTSIIQENVPNSFTTHPGIIEFKGKSCFFYQYGNANSLAVTDDQSAFIIYIIIPT